VVAELGGRVPVGPVHTNEDLFGDPHLRQRDMLIEIETPGATRPTTFVNTAIKYTRTPGGVSRRPPRLGEHTEEVLSELASRPSQRG
jgi:crotonobetainyl-CoA:carnitine CoA-transferase CaiB-like acyl-CoA transferase